jgi:hypothetical protein
MAVTTGVTILLPFSERALAGAARRARSAGQGKPQGSGEVSTISGFTLKSMEEVIALDGHLLLSLHWTSHACTKAK